MVVNNGKQFIYIYILYIYILYIYIATYINIYIYIDMGSHKYWLCTGVQPRIVDDDGWHLNGYVRDR